VDIVVLVVACDDGVKPQTEEALAHAKAAGVPIVVAINKVDKPDANPERVRNELAALELTPEEWGGPTAMLPVSALEGTGVEELLERVFLESEVLELSSHADGPASGLILEAEIQQGKGKVAHLLIKDGSLKRGDVILAGKGYGKVRSIHNDRGKVIKEAGPSMPVEITGLNELPTIGDTFYVVESLDRAREVANDRAHADRQQELLERSPTIHKDILFAVAEADKSAINLIVKADMQGSVEVIKQQIRDLVHEEMHVKVLHAGVGAVLESDVTLAISSDARILAFHTSAASGVRKLAEREGVQIKPYTVIYELLDDIKKLMEGELAPEIKEEVTGHAEIRRVFKSSKLGNIAGCMVIDGKILRSSKVRVMRDGELLFTGSIGTLRREAEDTKQVREGFECGIVIKDFNEIKNGDVFEAYRTYEVKRTL
jgi:translation initiation factor IF-2